MTDPTPDTPLTHRLRLADLPSHKPTRLVLEPDDAALEALAAALGVNSIRKLRFEAELRPLTGRDWSLRGRFGATVTQPCVVTLAPVTTRVEDAFERHYLADMTAVAEPGEAEMPEDVDAEPLPEWLDLGTVLTEALALALPQYPRAEGVEMGEARFAEKGVIPLSDEDLKPFAGLAKLRGKLGK